MTDTLPEVVTAHRVAKHLRIPLTVALEIPTDAVLAMSRYIEATRRPVDREAVARSLKARYGLRESIPELMMGLDIALNEFDWKAS